MTTNQTRRQHSLTDPLLYRTGMIEVHIHTPRSSPHIRDDFGRLWEPLISRVPFLCTGGNHEIEPGRGPEPVLTHQAYNARVPMPRALAPGQALPTAPNSGGTPRVRSGTNNLFYATELPGAWEAQGGGERWACGGARRG